MGTPVRRCDYNPKRWMIDTTITFPDGTRKHFKKRGYFSKADALADFERAKNEFISKAGYKSVRGDFAALIDLYISYQSTKVRPSTLTGIIGRINKYIKPEFDNKKLEQIYSLQSLNNFKNNINSLDVSNAHKNRVLTDMRQISEFAYKREFISDSLYKRSQIALESINNNEIQKTNYTVWTFEQYQQFIKTFNDNDPYKVLFQWMFYSGARIGETLALQWKDFDPDNRTIHIYKTANNRLSTGQSEISPTKTAAGNRLVYLNNAILSQFKDLKIAYGSNLDSYLFFGKNQPLGATTIRKHFNDHIIKAKLPKIKIHEIRHTNNTWLLNQFNSKSEADAITKRLGRSSLKTTLDIYYHTNQEDEIEMMDKFNIE